MTARQLQGKWTEIRGAIRERWGRLTDSEIDVTAGKRDQLVGLVQQRYDSSKAEAERQVDAFSRRFVGTH
jgi:uncharacterized protein YjbJ (UPF0337 family)